MNKNRPLHDAINAMIRDNRDDPPSGTAEIAARATAPVIEPYIVCGEIPCPDVKVSGNGSVTFGWKTRKEKLWLLFDEHGTSLVSADGGGYTDNVPTINSHDEIISIVIPAVKQLTS
jgi:hypothetical protein